MVQWLLHNGASTTVTTDVRARVDALLPSFAISPYDPSPLRLQDDWYPADICVSANIHQCLKLLLTPEFVAHYTKV